MSNKKLEEYKKFYTEYVEQLVTLHNNHLAFIEHQGTATKRAVRTTITKMIRLERKLALLCQDAYNERREEIREFRKRKKEIRAKHPRPMPIHRGKNPDKLK